MTSYLWSKIGQSFVSSTLVCNKQAPMYIEECRTFENLCNVCVQLRPERLIGLIYCL